MTLKGFKFEPVRWAMRALALVTALIAANELVHDITGDDIVPAGATPYLLFAEVLLALLLGVAVRNRVTPTARPRDDAGTSLVPKGFVSPPATPRRTLAHWDDDARRSG
jgi:hypothetical protein